MRRLLQQLTPFLSIGIALVALSFGLALLFYIIVFSTIVASTLYCFSWIKDKFKNQTIHREYKKSKNGRIIDSSDWRQL